MIARLIALGLLTAIARSQQPQTVADKNHSGSIGEPNLAVVTENVCPFEGCTFREWFVEKDTTLHSTWQDDRKEIGELKSGGTVQGRNGIYIARRPDRFLVTQPFPAFH